MTVFIILWAICATLFSAEDNVHYTYRRDAELPQEEYWILGDKDIYTVVRPQHTQFISYYHASQSLVTITLPHIQYWSNFSTQCLSITHENDAKNMPQSPIFKTSLSPQHIESLDLSSQRFSYNTQTLQRLPSVRYNHTGEATEHYYSAILNPRKSRADISLYLPIFSYKPHSVEFARAHIILEKRHSSDSVTVQYQYLCTKPDLFDVDGQASGANISDFSVSLQNLTFCTPEGPLDR